MAQVEAWQRGDRWNDTRRIEIAPEFDASIPAEIRTRETLLYNSDLEQLASARRCAERDPIGNVQRIQNLVFPVIIRSDEAGIDIDGARVTLSPGMSVTVEVKTGSRRILGYLYSPLAEISSEAMQER